MNQEVIKKVISPLEEPAHSRPRSVLEGHRTALPAASLSPHPWQTGFGDELSNDGDSNEFEIRETKRFR